MLGFNNLTGQVPEYLGELTELGLLSLSVNGLAGPVPPTLVNLTNLFELNLGGQTGCLTAATPSFAAWLASFDPYWNDGCPG
jgi:hypothetical protein